MNKDNQKQLLHTDEETIIAQCSPHGNGAIGLIRLSGTNCIEITDKISKLASGKKLIETASHTICYGSIIDAHNRIIDNVMFLLMHGPKTFTGQNTVEITAHNNPFILQSIIDLAIKNGARLAKNGEFTKRAFLNNKIDLIQAEAINELIHSQTQIALKSSLSQLNGSLSFYIEKIQKNLIKALAFSEASFEFIDEEHLEFGKKIKKIVNNTIKSIESLKKSFNQKNQIKEGVRVALIGSVNAGKSSLFNMLLNKKRAIVTNIAGTTRDVIEAGRYLDQTYQTLIDTAGLRKTNDIIEKEGINKSHQEAQKADIILLVVDNSKILTNLEIETYNSFIEKYENKIILIGNKSDLKQENNKLLKKNDIHTSSNNKESIEKLETVLAEKVKKLFSSISSPFLLNKRQYNLLIKLEQELKNSIVPLLQETISYELLSFHLNDALIHISELSGKSISEAGMDAVFREFCVGK